MRLWKKVGQVRSLMNIINKSDGLKRLALSKPVSNLVLDTRFSSFHFQASCFDTSIITVKQYSP
jgi:hypothetical protein